VPVAITLQLDSTIIIASCVAAVYRHDIVAGSKAIIADVYSAVQAYITAVWAYYVSKERMGWKMGAGKEAKGRGRKRGEERKCKEAKVK